jgi:Kdo2-lipid IVA lauroyltransferase/acyltransferase
VRWPLAAGVEARIARVNMRLIYPDWDDARREANVRAIVRAMGSNLAETLRIWTRGTASNEKLIQHVHGEHYLHAAISQQRGVILIAPHYGNWELLVSTMAHRAAFSLVYRDPGNGYGDLFLRKARARPRITLVPAEANAMRPLLRALQRGEVIGITPDQQPELSGGEFVPFFNHEALTMSLIPRLAARTDCALLMAYCEPTAAGFDLYFEPVSDEVKDKNLIIACSAINRAVELVATRDMSQYQWTYKRYSTWNPAKTPHNPYYPECYHHE